MKSRAQQILENKIRKMVREELSTGKDKKVVTWDVIYDIITDRDAAQDLVNNDQFFDFMVEYILNNKTLYAYAVEQYEEEHPRNALANAFGK